MKKVETMEELLALPTINHDFLNATTLIQDASECRYQRAAYLLPKLFENWNGGKKIDLTDGKKKYSMWVYAEKDAQAPSGVALSYYDFDLSYSGSHVGSRLMLHDWKDGKTLVENPEFHPLFRDYHLHI